MLYHFLIFMNMLRYDRDMGIRVMKKGLVISSVIKSHYTRLYQLQDAQAFRW